MSVLSKKHGAVQRIDDPLMAMLLSQRFVSGPRSTLYPDSPAWEDLSPRMQATLRACLKDAAGKYKCLERDLMISLAISSNRKEGPVIRVKKRQRIEI